MGFLLSERDVLRQRRVNQVVDALVDPKRPLAPPLRETDGQGPVESQAGQLCEFVVGYSSAPIVLTGPNDTDVVTLSSQTTVSRLPFNQTVGFPISDQPSFGRFKLASDTAVEVSTNGYHELTLGLAASFQGFGSERGQVLASIQELVDSTDWINVLSVTVDLTRDGTDIHWREAEVSRVVFLGAGTQLRLQVATDVSVFPASISVNMSPRMRIRKMATCPVGTQSLPWIQLASPADGATGVSTTPTLTWTSGGPSGSLADTYEVYLGLNSGFEPLVATVEHPTKSHTISTALDASSTYYWIVKARNETGETISLRRSFTTA